MSATYTTKSGDQWDTVARATYGSESYAGYLMEQNLPLLDTFQFDAGTVLNTPALPEEQDGSLPPWRYNA